ncbi:MAG: NADH-quinone oxidoreductase subunit N [Anaeromyxobacter sp.]
MDLQPLVQDNLASLPRFLPELWLGLGTLALFLLDVIWRRASPAARVARLSVATLLVLAAAGALLALAPVAPGPLFNGMLATDAFATFFKWLFLAAGAVTVLLAGGGREVTSARIGQFHGLLVAVVLGMFLMAGASDLLMMYLAIELVSMTSYALAGFRKGDRRAAEASLKYVIYGGVASGVMLFGMSYLYGLTGTFSFAELGPRLLAVQAAGLPLAATRVALVVGLVFVAAGIAYKVAAVPFHMWCPDVYEGAPTPFTAFLSVGPKAAGFALALRFFLSAFAQVDPSTGALAALGGIPWPAVLGVLAAVTMTLGNLTALSQTNLKRLLAYSSIAHAGYALMGLSAVSTAGAHAVMLYLAVYLVMNLGAFAVVIGVADATGSESILDYQGLSRRQPLAALTFVVFLLSLTGLPPFAGFIGKWYLFTAVWERTGGPGGGWYAALLLVAAVNTAISLGYYARVIRAMFLDPPHAAEAGRLRWPVGQQLLLGACALLVIWAGVVPQPVIAWTLASVSMFRG